MVKPIYIYGSEVLRQKADDIDVSSEETVKELIKDLWDTLAVSDGCGLAAPQIGVSSKVVVVDGTVMADVYPELKDFRRTIVNPEIIEESERSCVYNEGCLSIPGIYADVTRPAEMTLKYLDETLSPKTEHFTGFACRMIQHELSHLDGDLFVDHVAPIRRKMLTRKLENIAKGRVTARYKTRLER